MAETAEEKKKREQKEATLAGLKKRSDEGEKEREIVSGRGTEQVSNYGQGSTETKTTGSTGASRGTGYQERSTLKIAEPKPSSSPSPTAGAEQAKALRNPPAAAAATKPKTPAEMNDAELEAAKKSGNLAAAAESNRRKTGGKK